MPPGRWLFSAERVEKHHGWCRSETLHLRTPRAEPWPAAVRDYRLRLKRLHATVRGMHPVDDADRVRAAVAIAFPRGVEAHLADARNAARTQIAETRQALEAGAFLWS
jgi:hypothetical protein